MLYHCMLCMHLYMWLTTRILSQELILNLCAVFSAKKLSRSGVLLTSMSHHSFLAAHQKRGTDLPRGRYDSCSFLLRATNSRGQWMRSAMSLRGEAFQERSSHRSFSRERIRKSQGKSCCRALLQRSEMTALAIPSSKLGEMPSACNTRRCSRIESQSEGAPRDLNLFETTSQEDIWAKTWEAISPPKSDRER